MRRTYDLITLGIVLATLLASIVRADWFVAFTCALIIALLVRIIIWGKL